MGCYSGRVDLAVCLMDWDNIANEESAMRVPVTPVHNTRLKLVKGRNFPVLITMLPILQAATDDTLVVTSPPYNVGKA